MYTTISIFVKEINAENLMCVLQICTQIKQLHVKKKKY